MVEWQTLEWNYFLTHYEYRNVLSAASAMVYSCEVDNEYYPVDVGGRSVIGAVCMEIRSVK